MLWKMFHYWIRFKGKVQLSSFTRLQHGRGFSSEMTRQLEKELIKKGGYNTIFFYLYKEKKSSSVDFQISDAIKDVNKRRLICDVLFNQWNINNPVVFLFSESRSSCFVLFFFFFVVPTPPHPEGLNRVSPTRPFPLFAPFTQKHCGGITALHSRLEQGDIKRGLWWRVTFQGRRG